ncbi:MAG: hypothetical protein M1281_01365 [Chloroflexi bacterium]|nr:hypothetical protein [Chloroflexota bacterium]
MKKTLFVLMALVLLTTSAFAYGSSMQTPKPNPNLLEFGNMAPVQGPYVGNANPIRGINGGGFPWLISSGKGELNVNGKLEIQVKGLVLATTGSNPIPEFKAIVSCRSIDASGNASIVNVSTGLFPATTGPASLGGGDANIEATVSLPHPCIAPIVFVTSPTGAWFAATGN